MEDPLYLTFPLGINQELPPKDLDPRELSDALNMELSQQNALRRRDGVSKVVAAGGPFTSRLTSIYHFKVSDGSETVIYTDRTGAWVMRPGAPNSPGSMTDIATAVTLDSTDRFEWVTFDDVAIGVNGTDGSGDKDNPVILSSTSGQLTNPAGDSWNGSWLDAPEHIAVWNRRVWMSQGAQLKGCALGDRTDYTSTGGSGVVSETVGEDEGSPITGLAVFFDRLIIFKADSIYQVEPGSPNVDANQYNIKPLTKEVGCLDVGSVQEVGGDLVFLSEFGVTTLRAAAEFGDFKRSRLSLKIPSLAEVDVSGSVQVASVVRPDKSQYWLAVPATEGSTNNTVVWVLDFTNKDQGLLPWMKFDGGVCGSAYGLVKVKGESRVYIGGYDDAYMLDDSRWDDDVAAAYAIGGCYFETGSVPLGEPMRRKEYKKVGFQLVSYTDPVDWSLQWTLDDDPERTKTVTGSFSATVTGSELDDATDALLWSDDLVTTGSFLLAYDAADDSDVIRSLRGGPGRRAQAAKFKFSVSNDEQGFEVRRMALFAKLLRGLWGVDDS